MNYLNHNKARCLEAIVRDGKAKHREVALTHLGKMGNQAVPSLQRIATDTNVEKQIRTKVRQFLQGITPRPKEEVLTAEGRR